MQGEEGPKENQVKEEKVNTKDQITASTSQARRGRRNKKTAKVDMKAKLERSRQSARECRARKKLRYQYLEDLVSKRERAVQLIKKEIEMNRELLLQIDEGKASPEALKVFEGKSSRK